MRDYYQNEAKLQTYNPYFIIQNCVIPSCQKLEE